jgi:hypothetical protein
VLRGAKTSREILARAATYVDFQEESA